MYQRLNFLKFDIKYKVRRFHTNFITPLFKSKINELKAIYYVNLTYVDYKSFLSSLVMDFEILLTIELSSWPI